MTSDSLSELELAPHSCRENMSETEDSSDVRESKNGVVSEFGYNKIYTVTIHSATQFTQLSRLKRSLN